MAYGTVNADVIGTSVAGSNLGAGNATQFKNRIINGAMVIDQRNAGAEVNPAVNGTYYLDRWVVGAGAASKFKIGQNAGSVTPPVGFTNYLGATSLSAYTVGTSESFSIIQRIEGYNIADLGFGTANAKTVTLSFWVRSSLTGTFGGSLRNNGGTRSYPYTYTISSANTWEYKTVTVAGDTTGTWTTDNTVGIAVIFSLGAGSTLSGTAGAWAGTNYVSATGATSVVGTNGATFYITGVQLEVGESATGFDYRPYGTELALCQRYYYKISALSTADRFGIGYASAATLSDSVTFFPITLRTNPTALEQTGTASDYGVQQASGATTCSAVPTFITASASCATSRFTVASGLTTGQGNFSRGQNTSAYLAWSAEL